MALVTTADIVTFTRDRLRESTENAWTDLQLVRAINERLQQASRFIKKTHPTYLHATTTISYVADQATYSLPIDFWGLLAYPLRTDLDPDSAIGYTPFHQYHKYLGFSSGWFSWNKEVFTFQGSDANKKLRITPVPTSATGTLELHYIRRPCALTSGTAAAGSAATLTLDSSPTYGTNDVRDDYYNGADFLISAGTGAGEVATATDFVGSTRVVTIDFTTTPSTDSVYSVLPPWSEDFNYLLAYGAAATLLDDLSIPNNYEAEYGNYLQLMISSLKRTHAPKYVHATDLDRER